MKKLLTILLLIVGCGKEESAVLEPLKIEGCMNEQNANYNPEATTHVADSCAVQIYGCTDSTALNYDSAATNMCQGISTDQCCTYGIFGCTDPNCGNYNENANVDDGSCCQ